MLDALRRGAQSWMMKWLLLVPLVFAFAIWGVADVFRGYGAGSLAKVGKIEISSAEFQRAYELQLDQLRRQFGGRINAEQARQFGIDAQVLSRLIGSTAVDAHAQQLRLGLSDQSIVAAIEKDPSFQGLDGKFNRLALDNFLRQNGLTERGFIALRRKDEVREQITDSLMRDLAVPRTTLELVHAFRDETRVVEHYTIDPAKLPKLADPDDAMLTTTYEQNKKQFVHPEYRKLAVLLLSAEEVKRAIPVSDADIKASYEAEKERYNEPERRRVQQISFPSKAVAEAAAKAIGGGKSFLDAAKDVGAKESDINLGLMARKELIDPKIAEAVFSLAKDKVSAVVEGRFATVLVRVTEIQAGKQKALDEVKGEVRERLAADRAGREIQQLHDKVDDNKGAGKTLKEIADLLKLKHIEVAGADRAGKAADGKPAFEGPDGQRIVAAAFEAKSGVESDAIELADGGYAWVDVLATTPEKQRAFEEVKSDVKTVWLDVEARKALQATAVKLAERAKAGESMEALAKEAGGKLERSQAFNRFGNTPGLSAGGVRQAFAVAKGGATATDTTDGKSRIVLKVVDIVPAPALGKEQADKLQADLARQLQQDRLAEYVAALQDRLGVSINEAEFRRSTGADRQTQQ